MRGRQGTTKHFLMELEGRVEEIEHPATGVGRKKIAEAVAAATAEATEEATAEATKEKNELKMKIAKLKEQLEHRLRSRRLNPQTRRVTEGSRPPLLTE